MAKKLYVGGLSYDTTEDTLKKTFAEAGTVESVAIITDRGSDRSKGFGFVEMSTEEEGGGSGRGGYGGNRGGGRY